MLHELVHAPALYKPDVMLSELSSKFHRISLDFYKLFSNGLFPGNKMNNVGIVYTLWDNLKKTNDMEVGQVGFHKQKEVYPIVFCM